MKNNSKQQRTVDARIVADKAKVLEQLKKVPIIKVACEWASVGRATYYRWYNQDVEFRNGADLALIEGDLMINDMSEYQLLKLIQDKNGPAIKYWLEHHHPKYQRKSRSPFEPENAEPEVTKVTVMTYGPNDRLANVLREQKYQDTRNCEVVIKEYVDAG